MNNRLPIDNIRRFLGIKKNLIKSSGLAAEINKDGASPVTSSLLFRVLTENLEQQREPGQALIPRLEAVLTKQFNYNPEINYTKHPEKA